MGGISIQEASEALGVAQYTVRRRILVYTVLCPRHLQLHSRGPEDFVCHQADPDGPIRMTTSSP